MDAAPHWEVALREGLAVGASTAPAVKPSWQYFLPHEFPVTNPPVSLQMPLIC